jgi:hypothetical protein
MINKNISDGLFKNLIYKCVSPNDEYPEYAQLFVDYHNNCILELFWMDDVKKKIENKEYPDTTKIYKLLSLEFFLGTLDKNYRSQTKLLNATGQIARHNITYSIEKNAHEDRDMFWVSYATRAIFMSYFIGHTMLLFALYSPSYLAHTLLAKLLQYEFLIALMKVSLLYSL